MKEPESENEEIYCETCYEEIIEQFHYGRIFLNT